MDMVFLLIMICLNGECEKNLIDQYESADECMSVLEVIQWELSPHIQPGVGVTLWCDIDSGVIMMERDKILEDSNN